MNIYHIKFTGHDYDDYKSALGLINKSIPYGESVDEIICICTSNETEPRIVLGSFNAG